MRLDQAVGRKTADEERHKQDPEGSARPDLVKHVDWRGHHGAEAEDLLWGRLDRLGAIRREADVGRPVAQRQERDEACREQHRDDEGKRAAPPVVLRRLGEKRQENELACRVARRQHADDKAATLDEPARRDRCAEHQGDQAGADADNDAPQRDELPDLGHRQRGQNAETDHRYRCSDDGPDAEAVDEGGRKRRHQPEERDA
jgi:hypothetical protein